MPLNAGHDQTAADRARLFDVGTIGYCPVCRRPTSDLPIPAGDAMRAVGRHLLEDHDSYFAALLGLALAPPVPAAETADAFHPTGESW